MKALLAILFALLFAAAATAAEIPFKIRFAATGDFEIVGNSAAALEGGIASVLVRIRKAAARGSLTVRAEGLAPGSLRR